MNIADFKFIIKIYNDKFDFNLWDKYEGITEEVLIENGKGKNIFNCYKCGWSSDTFLDFIPELDNDNNSIVLTTNAPLNENKNVYIHNNNNINNINNINNVNSDVNLINNNNYIYIILISEDLKYFTSLLCDYRVSFETLEKALNEKYPGLNYKQIYFTHKGKVIKRKSNLNELNFRNMDVIIFYGHEKK